MTSNRLCTHGLFAGGLILLFLGWWLLHVTLPPREPGARSSARKLLRLTRGPRLSEKGGVDFGIIVSNPHDRSGITTT